MTWGNAPPPPPRHGARWPSVQRHVPPPHCFCMISASSSLFIYSFVFNLFFLHEVALMSGFRYCTLLCQLFVGLWWQCQECPASGFMWSVFNRTVRRSGAEVRCCRVSRTWNSSTLLGKAPVCLFSCSQDGKLYSLKDRVQYTVHVTSDVLYQRELNTRTNFKRLYCFKCSEDVTLGLIFHLRR